MGFKDNGARLIAKAGYKKAKAVEQANSELSALIAACVRSDLSDYTWVVGTLGVVGLGTIGEEYASNFRIRSEYILFSAGEQLTPNNGIYSYRIVLYNLEKVAQSNTEWLNTTYTFTSECYARILIRISDSADMTSYLAAAPTAFERYSDTTDKIPYGALVGDIPLSKLSEAAQATILDDDTSYVFGKFDDYFTSTACDDVSAGQTFDLGASDSADIYTYYDALVTENSAIMSRALLGYATAVGGTADETRPIYEYTIINPMDARNLEVTPTILLVTGVHGNEKSTVWSAYQFISQMLSGWSTSEILGSIKCGVNFKIIPIANPYGYDNNLRLNARSVNINRNFAYNWENTVSEADSKGSAPYSELETQVLRDWMADNPGALAFIDFHNTMIVGRYSYIISQNAKLNKLYSALIRRIHGIWSTVYNIDISTQTAEFIATAYWEEPITANDAYYTAKIRNSALFEICQYDENQTDKAYTADIIEEGVELLANYIAGLLKNVKY